MYRSSVKIVPGTKQNNTPIRAYARIHSYSNSICGHLRVLPKLVHTCKYHYTTIYMCTSCKHPSNYVSKSDRRGSSTKTSKDWCESRWPSAKEYNMSPQNMRENRKPRIMRSFLWIWHWSHSSCGSGIEAILQMDEPSFAAISLGCAKGGQHENWLGRK